MIATSVPGHLVVVQNTADLAREAATRLAQVLRDAKSRPGRATLALSGGRTPRDAYARLAEEQGIDWAHVDIDWVDERAVAPTDNRSNYRWAKATLLDTAGVPPERVHRMPADAQDLEEAARAYERTLREHVVVDGEGVAAFDAMVLGVGDDGHTASLFPRGCTIEDGAAWVAAVEAHATREARLTLTATVIEHARALFVLVLGEDKRAALERVWAVDGDVHQTPARIIRRCRGTVTWLVDSGAAGKRTR